MRRLLIAAGFAGLILLGLSLAIAMSGRADNAEAKPSAAATAADRSTKTIALGTGNGIAAMEQASQAGKYLFAFFWKDESGETSAARAVFESATKQAADRAQAVQVRVSDPAEKSIVEKFGLDRAPMPLVLAIAPNGAILGGFPQKFTEEDLLNSFGSPCTEQCMKGLQDGNPVLLCVQNKGTAGKDEALKGVREFAADSRYASATQVVMLDPADPAEHPFLADLQIDPKSPEAVTAFLVPPGSVIAEFKGATSKDELIAALEKANTACGPGGCGPGGCGPAPQGR